MSNEQEGKPAPQFRVYVNDGNGGSYDIHDLDDVANIAAAQLSVMTPIGQETGVNLRILRIKSK